MDVGHHDKRSAIRSQPLKKILVNRDHRCKAGYIRDVSVSGAAINYVCECPPAAREVSHGAELELIISGDYGILGEVVRIFDEGYAVRFKRR